MWPLAALVHGMPAAAPDEASSTWGRPKYMLIGAQKAGTTSVYDVLHEALKMCGSTWEGALADGKEAHFFDPYAETQADEDAQYPVGSAEKYINSFTGDGCSYFMDATPNYLYTGITPYRMITVMPASWQQEVKLIAILRDPISRDLSIYNMMKGDWRKDKASNMTAQGSIKSELCLPSSATSFPTYDSAAKCSLSDWETRCMTHTDNLIGIYNFCQTWGTSPEVVNTTQGVVSDVNYDNRLTRSMYYPQVRLGTSATSGWVAPVRARITPREALSRGPR